MAGYGAKEARIIRETRERINLCGACGIEVSATELLCKECRGTPRLTEEESEGESARRRR